MRSLQISFEREISNRKTHKTNDDYVSRDTVLAYRHSPCLITDGGADKDYTRGGQHLLENLPHLCCLRPLGSIAPFHASNSRLIRKLLLPLLLPFYDCY